MAGPSTPGIPIAAGHPRPVRRRSNNGDRAFTSHSGDRRLRPHALAERRRARGPGEASRRASETPAASQAQSVTRNAAECPPRVAGGGDSWPAQPNAPLDPRGLSFLEACESNTPASISNDFHPRPNSLFDTKMVHYQIPIITYQKLHRGVRLSNSGSCRP